MTRTFHLTLAAAAVLAAVACSDGNDPAVQDPMGDGDGDDVTGDGDTGGTTGGDGDGAGGVVGDGDGSGGMTSGDGDGDGATLGNPPCGVTLAGEEIKKAVACTADDVQLCWRACGPQSSGWKSETCTGGAYAEGDCMFPAEGDYACYAIDDPQDAACPAEEPQASQLCDVPTCSTCNFNGQYKDSGGAVKQGYCVCQEPNGSGERKWSCGSATAWPCPLGNGCSQ